MKKTLFLLSVILISISCSDDEVAPANETHNALLTRISKNGITEIELSYDLDRKLNRLNIYTLGKYSSYNLYEYDESGLKELRRYSADDHSLFFRTIFTRDNFGRIIKAENCASPNFSTDQIATLHEFEFNSSGQLEAKNFRWNAQPAIYVEEFAYDDSNNLIQWRRTLSPNQEDEYLALEIVYTPGERTIPDHWQDYFFILGISGFEDSIIEMINVTAHSKSWNSNQVPHSDFIRDATDHMFDPDGNLTRQTITKRDVLHPENPSEVSVMSYDYKQEN